MDLRNFSHQYYAPLRTSVTLLKFVTELINTPYGAAYDHYLLRAYYAPVTHL